MPDAPDAASSAGSVEDAALMRRIAARDREALGQMVRRHQDRVWAVAYRFCGRHADADDIAQETFIRLWNAAGRWEPSARVSTWLYRIVANLCVDLRRKQARAPLPLDAAGDGGAEAGPPPVEAEETAERVRRAIAVLPERQRMAVILHRYEGLSYRQIAETTGWGEAAIESLLSRAYASLRLQLQDLRVVT